MSTPISRSSSTSTRTAQPATTGRTFPLGTVRLGPGPFADAQQRALEAVLDLDLDRLLAPFVAAAGLDGAAPDAAGLNAASLGGDAEPYGDWESGGLDGHIGGHALSAHAKLWAVTGLDVLHDRLEHLLDVLERCQDAVGTGYLGGVPNGPALGDELAAGRIDADLFELNGRWVPVYNFHKTFAGLIDAATHGRSERALGMATRWADWWLSVTKALTDEQVEQILTAEFGGLNEAFVELGALTGRADLVAEGRRLAHRRLLDPLADGGDPLDGLHANTQIPKVLGYQRLADLPDGDPGAARFAAAADAFWTSVVERRTLAIGGNSVREHFHPSSDFTEVMTDHEGPETCNTHNLAELARLRLHRGPDGAAVDLAERALFNHLVSSVHPRRGGFVYFTPMRPAHYRVYSRPHLSMWCCVGSGLEGHTRYNELIYTHDGPDLRVELYAPSVLDWAEEGLRVELSTALPYDDEARVVVTSAAPRARTLRLRVPSWADLAGLSVDGKPVEPDVVDGYAEIARTWSGTTAVTVRLAPRLVAEGLPDGSGWVAFRYGPLVLASRDGGEDLTGLIAGPDRMAHIAHGRTVPLAQSPIVAAGPASAVAALTPVDDRTATFELAVLRERSGELVPGTVLLEPFAGIHDERYSLYFAADVDPSRALDALQRLDAATTQAAEVFDKVTAGEQQPEVDHGFTGERTQAGGSGGVHWRSTTGWFEYRLRRPGGPAAVRARFVDRAGTRRKVLLNGVEVAPPRVTTAADGGPAEHEYDLTEAVRQAGAPDEVVFRVEAVDGADSGDLLVVEVVRTAP